MEKTKIVCLFSYTSKHLDLSLLLGISKKKMQKCNILSTREIKHSVDSKIFPVLQFLSAERREIMHSRSYFNFRRPIAKI